MNNKNELKKPDEINDNLSRELEYELIKYQLTNKALGIGMWDAIIVQSDPFNPDNTFIWSDELRKMLGYSNEQDFPNVWNSLLDRIHPDDYEFAHKQYTTHFYDSTGQSPFSVEHRVKLKNGNYIYVHAFGTTQRDKEGKPIRFVGALRNIDESVKLQNAVKYRDKLLSATNKMAGLLLNSDAESFNSRLTLGMNLIADAAKIDAIYLWKNKTINNELVCYQLFEWLQHKTTFTNDAVTCYYDQELPGWKETLSSGNNINGIVRDMPKEVQNHFTHTVSTLVIPIFIDYKFWGIVGFSDYHNERLFSSEDEVMLTSAGIIIANAFIRNKMMQDIVEANNEANEATLIKNNSLRALDNILNSMDVPIYVSVPDTGEILFVNDWLKNVFNIVGDEAIGKYCFKVFRNFDEMCSFCPCFELKDDPGKLVVWDEYVAEISSHIRHADCLIDWPDGRKVHLQYATDITTLVNATEVAKSASRAKSDFLSNMSHEIRTPLNVIVGMTTIGIDAENIERKDYALGNIHEASKYLLGIVNSILDMAKIEADKLEISFIDFDFRKTIHMIIALIRFKADEKNHELTLDIDSNIPSIVVGDDQLIAQVITNILSNSIKFTPDGGKINLSAKLVNEINGKLELQIKVKDNGIGISPDRQDKLFDSFEQAENGMHQEYGGTGLGLAIAKRIINKMGGEISVESDLDKGATFTFNVFVQRYVKSNDDGIINDNESDDSAASDEIIFKDKVLLIAEDIDINREIISSLLSDKGFIIEQAENGKQALDMVTENPDKYDVIFMDMQMPQMDGLEATEKIRNLPSMKDRTRKLWIVAMTANIFKTDIEACLSAGMDNHLGKPIDREVVLDMLREYLR
ncbi:MAG: response regulator [Oscillospiraceae bacterium]|jgi:PAS domain S-box-containing protein|nr:response regulator [Oscillospiraceae bacterium]